MCQTTQCPACNAQLTYSREGVGGDQHQFNEAGELVRLSDDDFDIVESVECPGGCDLSEMDDDPSQDAIEAFRERLPR